jgi:hypothetical protein
MTLVPRRLFSILLVKENAIGVVLNARFVRPEVFAAPN